MHQAEEWVRPGPGRGMQPVGRSVRNHWGWSGVSGHGGRSAPGTLSTIITAFTPSATGRSALAACQEFWGRGTGRGTGGHMGVQARHFGICFLVQTWMQVHLLLQNGPGHYQVTLPPPQRPSRAISYNLFKPTLAVDCTDYSGGGTVATVCMWPPTSWSCEGKRDSWSSLRSWQGCACL